MSNPLTSAPLEAQDRQAPKTYTDETSTKMGLEVLVSSANAFAGALFDSAVQTPVNGLIQLFNPQEAHALKLVENKQQSMGSAEWLSQLVGSGAGSLLNYVGLSKVLKGSSESIKFLGAPATSKFWRPLANTVSLVEKSPICQKPLLAAATTGAFYGGILTPVDPNGENMIAARLKNAGVGAASVATMILPNQIRLNRNAINPGETGSKVHEALALALGGPLAGLVHAEGRALCQSKIAPDLNSRDFKESVVGYSILGVGYAGYRSIGKSQKAPEVEEYESAEKLRATRRPERTNPPKTRDEHAETVREWKQFVELCDKTIHTDIETSPVTDLNKLDLKVQHQRGMRRLDSDPANIGSVDSYQKHFDYMYMLLNKAIKNDRAMVDAANEKTQRAIDEWNAAHPDTPAQPGDLVIPNPTQQAQLPATFEQVQQKTNSPAPTEQWNPFESQLPAPIYDGQSMTIQHVQAAGPSPTELLPKATGLTNSRLGQRAFNVNQSMAGAKRANVNTPAGTLRKQNDLAETIYSNRNADDPNKVRGLSFRNTTFEKKGYTAEQTNKKAMVNGITGSSKHTSEGIGSPEELHQKSKFKQWNGDEEP